MKITFKSFWVWIKSLFDSPRNIEYGVHEEKSEIKKEVREDKPIDLPAGSVKLRRVAGRTRSVNLKMILSELDRTFSNLARDVSSAIELESLTKSDIKALKKIGPLVRFVVAGSDEYRKFLDQEYEFPSNDKLPSFFIIAINGGEDSTEDRFECDFMFGIKMKKTPWFVTKQPGQAWRIGMAWRLKNGKLAWGTFYCYTLRGKVVPASWLCNQNVPLPGQKSYVRRIWTTASWCNPHNDPGESVRNLFSWALWWYCNRGNHWNIAVNKGDSRAVFTIDPKDTAYAFKDRKIEALAPDGKRKRIIHHVREHIQHRPNKDVVIPEHIRGIREFAWNGYKVFVTAPKFHSLNIIDFKAAGEEFPEEDPFPKGYVTSEEIAQILVAAEQELNTKRPLH